MKARILNGHGEADHFASFEEFWSHYVKEHSRKSTRMVHLVGTFAAVGCITVGLTTRRRWFLLLAPILGYGPAWASHFLIEKNRPLTFRHPLWSLRADLEMVLKTLRGTMDEEVQSVLRKAERASTPEARN